MGKLRQLVDNVVSSNTIVFRRTDDIGAAAAEDDTLFLSDCFVDTGDLEVLTDMRDPRRIVSGRTGAGKSALLQRIAESEEHVITLMPNELALNYIANNSVINFFEALGVNLDPFYNLLWKHVLIVELLREKFGIKDEDSQKNYMRNVRRLLFKKDKNKEMAVDYLENWGNKFWLTSEERIRELTTRVEKELVGSLGVKYAGIAGSIGGVEKLSEEERTEVVARGRQAVSSVQIRELENIVAVLAEDVFGDRQKKFYVCIDCLDEDWVDESVKLKLIRALIATVRKLQRIPNVKAIIALRDDLLETVLRLEQIPGFQDDKVRSLAVEVAWSRGQLLEVLDKRIGYLFRHRYTKDDVHFNDVFPQKVDGMDTFAYILQRTFYRPRDVILFINQCIRHADGECVLRPQDIKGAEFEFSRARLQALSYEWERIFPNLGLVCSIFQGLPNHFSVSSLTDKFLSDRYLQIAGSVDRSGPDRIVEALETLYDTTGNVATARRVLIADLFMVGFFGVKIAASSPVQWAVARTAKLSAGAIRANSTVYIHPMFHKALGINAN